MAEFTGERLVPGEVDVDLLNEHLARYAFAARLARGKRVLDAGCGAGYGAAELAEAAESVVGVDVAPEAIEFAAAHYQLPNLRFEQASCTALPNSGGSFDLVVAFEVIEHLNDWRGFLAEARRVLTPNGQLVVSTPNRLYYTESRGPEGANPFHVHEFDFAEFCAELQAVFPHVSLFLENHVEGVTFQPHTAGDTVEVRVDAGEPAPDESHFFVAVCANRPQLGNPTFVYVPRAANVLRERERHIGLLEKELADKDQWLAKSLQDLQEFDRQHQKLMGLYEGVQEELERSHEWAASLNQEMEKRGARVLELQEELIAEQARAQSMADGYAAELERAHQWTASLNQELEERRARVVELQEEFARQQASALRTAEGYAAKVRELEADVEAKAGWAASLNQELEERRARVVELQEEFAAQQASALRMAEGYSAKVLELEADARSKTEWAASLASELERQTQALAATVEQLHLTEKDLAERTAWALQLQEEARVLGDQAALYRASRWVKLGRKVGLGPDIPAS